MELANTSTVILPDAPAVPGLTFRRYRGPSDHAVMLAVLQGCKEVDRIEWIDTPEDIDLTYANLTNSDPYEDMLFAEVDGRAVGYQRVAWRREGGGDTIYTHFGYLLPAWRRLGIGRAMLHHAERRLRETAAGHAGSPGSRLFHAEVPEWMAGTTAMLQAEGYSVVRVAFFMVRSLREPIPKAAIPPGLEVRPAGPEQYPAVWRASDEAFRDHWGYFPQTEQDYRIWRDNRRFQPDLWQVAWDGDEVAGMVLNFVDPEENRQFSRLRGYTENICVRRPWRRRGLARALLLRSLALLRDRGLEEAGLGVDAENRLGALQLYESVGFRPAKVFHFYRKPLEASG